MEPLRSAARRFAAAALVLAALVVVTDATLRTVAPLVALTVSGGLWDVAEERYDPPEGANWLTYGTLTAVAGAALALLDGSPWVGSALAVVGCWFVLDGATTLRYGSSGSTSEYVADLDGRADEAMLRMQTLSVVYRRLTAADTARTPAALADDLDLTESRVRAALDYLAETGRVERSGDRYSADAPRWGRLTPLLRFLVWLPRRLVRPFRRPFASA